MSFQDKVSSTMHNVLNHPEYKIPYNKLIARANMKAMELQFDRKQVEKEGMEI